MGKMKITGGRKLVVLSGKAKGTAFVLTEPEVKAGRESDNAICLKGKRVSRYHAVLVRTNGEYTLRDVSPQIGTMLNGKRTKEAALKLGDRIRIGEIEMSYEAATMPVMEASPATAPAPMEEVPARVIPVMAAQEEPVAEMIAETPVLNDQRRIAELTQETERLVGELKAANEGLESLRAQLQTQSEQQADLMERLGAVSQDNAVLMKLNSELQVRISEGEVSAEEAHRVNGELTHETKRLVGEVRQANEALESLHAQLRMQSDVQADLTAQLGAMTQEKAALAKRNSELQTRVSELKVSAAKADRVEIELASAQAALHQMGEELAKTREAIKPQAVIEPALNAVEHAEVAEPIHTVPVEAHGQRNKMFDLAIPFEPVADESEAVKVAAAKSKEEAVAKRQASEKTNEQFDRIRRTIVEKKNERAKMTFLERFMLPFRDTARLVVQEPASTVPEQAVDRVADAG